MSLYRTNSDRGLWKKYRSEQPKHFHKPCYIGKEQERTQVTYSQLQLGEDDGFHRVLNSRNSNFSYYKNASKSAPATPRATTPTRQRRNKYNRMNEGPPSGSAGAGARPVNGTASAAVAAANNVETGLLNGGHSRPVTSNSVYSQDVDENASSWDSRSLGRDSALGPYMSAYREPQHRPASEDFFSDRPNPFLQGSNIANEADNVVQMFLMSMTNRQNFSSPDQTVALDDQANNKTILAQMRKDFFTTQQQSPEQREQTKVTNKYLKPENRYVPPVPQALSTSNTNAEDQVVQSFVAPQMHHAEVVHVRQDSTSTEASMEASFDTQVSHYEEEEVSKKKGFLKSLFNKKSSSKKASPAPPPQEIYPDDDVDYDPPPMIAAPLERKRSMSKPTDLDEILRLQEEEEQRNVNHIFANDPFFNQSSTGQPALPKRSPNPPSALNNSFTTEPLYENRIDLNTTQEIDIDAALGYCDEEAIDNIDWPKTEEDQAPLPPPLPQTELTLDYAPPPAAVQSKSKRSFFSFGTKKKKSPPSNVEVSYYVDSPPTLEQPQSDQNDELEQPEYKDSNKKSGSFFKFKNYQTKENRMKEPIDDMATLELGDSDIDHHQPKPSLFNFKSKTVKKHKTFEDHPKMLTDDDGEAAEIPIQHLAEPEPRHVPVLVEEETKEEEGTTPIPVKIETSTEWTKERTKNKSPGFFSFKGKSSKAKEKVTEEHVHHVPISIGDPVTSEQEEPNKTNENIREEPITKPSFFSFKSKSRSREVPIQIEPEPEVSLQQGHHLEVTPNDDEEMDSERNEITKDEVKETLETTADSSAEIAPDGTNELGPIKEEQPSFSRPPSAGDKSTSRPAKRKGLSGLFKSKKSQQQKLPKQIGTMQPVDVSHLVDEDDVEVEVPPPEQPVEPTEEQPLDRSRTRKKSGAGLSSFFSNRPNSQTRDRDNFTRNDRRSRSLPRSSKRDLQDPPGHQQPLSRPQQRHPPPKSKSMGGFFNLQPKHPRRPQVPPPAPPASAATAAEESTHEQASEPIHETNSSRAASRTGSMSSLASSKRRETKGLSNFLGTSPLRKSNRMPRSQTFPKVPQPNGQMVSKPPTPLQDLKTHEDTDKIEIASDEPLTLTQNQDLPPRAQGRVMGRRSGRFRKNPEAAGELNYPSQLPKGPHTVPSRPEESSEKQNKSDSTEHSVARDLFAQAVNKPGPVVVSNKSGKIAGSGQPFPHADNEYDQAVNKVNRNDSYRRAGQMRNYNSLPRLGNRKKDEHVEPQPQVAAASQSDPETRSLDGRRRRHQRPSNDNCQMM